ncbi:MAG: PAS domain-containing protein [Gammaproteobacteria bacterium]|nr:PAS domain-containing protein [Gammaproteobacteria bacterium]
MLDGQGNKEDERPLRLRRAGPRRTGATARQRARERRAEELAARLQDEIAAHYATHRALLESRGMLDSVIKSISEAVFIKDLDSRYLVFNAAAERMFEVGAAQVLGRKADALFGAEAARRMLAADLDVIQSRAPITYEVTGAAVDSARIYLTTKAPFFDTTGEMVGIISISKDSTERKQQELAFARQAAQLAMAQRIARTGSWEHDLVKGTVWRSEEVCRLLGVPRHEIDTTLQAFMDYIEPAAVPRVRAALARTMETGEPYSEEYWLRTAGGRRYVHSMAEIARAPDGRAMRIVGTVQDITDRKLADDRLRESEAELAEAQRIAHFGSWAWDIASGAIRWSAETYRMFGVAPDEFSPSLDAYWQFVHPDDLEPVQRATLASLDAARDFTIDYRIVPRDGEVRVVHSVGELRRAPDGTPIGMTGTIYDITDRKRAEDALRRSEKRLAQAQEIARVGSWEIDLLDGQQVVSDGACRIFGLDPAAGPYRLRDLRAMMSPADREQIDAAAGAMISGGAALDLELRIDRADGAQRIVHSVAEVLRDADGVPVALLGTVQDVTERRQYEEALAESHREMRQLYHHLQEVQEDERGRIAREVHDEFGAVLTALHLAVHRLTNLAAPASPEAAEVIAQMRGMLATASESLDHIVDGLQPQMLTYLGIAATVDWYCSKFADRTKIRCESELPKKELEVEPQAAVALFRCLQESLTNVAKHARARQVHVVLAARGANIELDVADDGRGLGHTPGRRPNGFGIRGMTERVTRLGGQVVMDSGPLGGTRVRVTLPRNNTNN